jgi:hypothetical protein
MATRFNSCKHRNETLRKRVVITFNSSHDIMLFAWALVYVWHHNPYLQTVVIKNNGVKCRLIVLSLLYTSFDNEVLYIMKS